MGFSDGAWNAWGGLSLGVCDLLYRRKAALMMVRSGAALKSQSGGNDEKGKLVMEREEKTERRGATGSFLAWADRRRRVGDFGG